MERPDEHAREITTLGFPPHLKVPNFKKLIVETDKKGVESMYIVFKGKQYQVTACEIGTNAGFTRYIIEGDLKSSMNTFVDDFHTKRAYDCRVKEINSLFHVFADDDEMKTVLEMNYCELDDTAWRIISERNWYSASMSAMGVFPHLLNLFVAMDDLIITISNLIAKKGLHPMDVNSGNVSFNHNGKLPLTLKKPVEVTFVPRIFIEKSAFERVPADGETFSRIFPHDRFLVANRVFWSEWDLDTRIATFYAGCIAEIVWASFFVAFGTLPLWLVLAENPKNINLIEDFLGVTKSRYGLKVYLENKKEMDPEEEKIVLDLIWNLIKEPHSSLKGIQECLTMATKRVIAKDRKLRKPEKRKVLVSMLDTLLSDVDLSCDDEAVSNSDEKDNHDDSENEGSFEEFQRRNSLVNEPASDGKKPRSASKETGMEDVSDISDSYSSSSSGEEEEDDGDGDDDDEEGEEAER